MTITRRRFLQIGAAGGGGLLLSFHLPGLASPTETTAATAHPFNLFLSVRTDGRAEVRIPVPEIGQGVRTSLAMIVAEELDVEWGAVDVVQMDAAEEMGPHPMAGGSHAVRDNWQPLRDAGATARAVLVETAAERWGVEPSRCRTEPGAVIESGTGRRLGYGELVEAAARRPAPTDVRLKDPSEFRLIGTSRRMIDAPAIVTGTRAFGLDTRVPGMLRAVIARCPTYGGRVRGYDDAAALRVPGVRQVVKVDRVGGTDERPYAVEGVAVVAESTWAALEGRRALQVDWDLGSNADVSTDRLHEVCRDLISRRAGTFRESGVVDRALADAARRVEAVYHAPFLAHAPMEPMNCLVHVRGDGCEIWAPTQMPQGAWRNAIALLDMAPEDVVVHVTPVGGGFGRRLSLEFLFEAIQVARQVDAPVQLVWTRTDDMRHGFFRPFSYHRLEAGLDDEGRIQGWLHRQAGTSRYAFRDGQEPGLSEFREGTYPAGLAPSYRLEYALAGSNMPVGPLRAPGLNAFTFAAESFVEEVARAAGRDPVELRLELLGARRVLPYGDDDVFDTGRMRHVIETAAEASGWGRSLPPGRGRGMGAMSTFGSYAAQVAEVSVDPGTGRVRVHRVACAIDCGRAVNPNGVRAQMEGGIIDGLGAALYGEITIRNGAVEQANYGDYPILRFDEAPAIDVHIIDSDEPPTGAGEPPYPPIFAALANAIHDASGARVRTLPARPERVREALRAAATGPE